MRTEIEKRYRQNRRANGLTQIAVWLDRADQERIAQLMERFGCSKSDAIRSALQIAGPALKVAEVNRE